MTDRSASAQLRTVDVLLREIIRAPMHGTSCHLLLDLSRLSEQRLE